jgi:hypothetical protein
MKRKKVNDDRDLRDITELAYEIHDTKKGKKNQKKKS